MNDDEYEDLDELEVMWDFEAEEERLRECQAIWGEKDNFFKVKELFETGGRDEIDWRLDELLRHPPIGMAPQSPETVEWMTEEERRSIEWFDREEYDVFMKRSAWYDGDGWIIPYYRQLCEEMHLASDEVLGDFAIDYKIKYAHLRFSGDEEEPWVEASRTERLVRVADKILSATAAGNPRAMNIMGTFCEKGVPRCLRESFMERGVKPATAAAHEWYGKSAERGCVQGQRNYARVLFDGIGAEWRDSAIAERVAGAARDRKIALDLYRDLASRGDGKAQYRLACVFAQGGPMTRDIPECARWLRIAAKNGHRQAASALAAAGDDTSDERLFVELLILWQKERLGGLCSEPDYTVALRIKVKPEFGGGSGNELEPELGGDSWLLKDKPEGTVLPPSAGRDRIRVPNLTSANPSFAARLIILVRDRFGGDAPAVYKAAHVSRKTYSSIVSNELRPVAKDTAVAFALAMRLSPNEADDLLKSAGFSFSQFYLEDIIVKTCITAGIYDIERVNAILAAHGAKTFRTE